MVRRHRQLDPCVRWSSSTIHHLVVVVVGTTDFSRSLDLALQFSRRHVVLVQDNLMAVTVVSHGQDDRGLHWIDRHGPNNYNVAVAADRVGSRRRRRAAAPDFAGAYVSCG